MKHWIMFIVPQALSGANLSLGYDPDSRRNMYPERSSSRQLLSLLYIREDGEDDDFLRS